MSHSGTNHKQSSRLVLQPRRSAHPILRGVKDVWVQSGGYTADPIDGSEILAVGEILEWHDARVAGRGGQEGAADRLVSAPTQSASGKAGGCSRRRTARLRIC